MNIDWSTAKVHIEKCGPTYFYYVADYDGNVLHCDGSIKKLLVNGDGAYTSFFTTEARAKNCLDKYKPKTMLKDVRVGQIFSFVGEGRRYARVSANELAACLNEDCVVVSLPEKLLYEVVIHSNLNIQHKG